MGMKYFPLVLGRSFSEEISSIESKNVRIALTLSTVPVFGNYHFLNDAEVLSPKWSEWVFSLCNTINMIHFVYLGHGIVHNRLALSLFTPNKFFPYIEGYTIDSIELLK